MKSRAHVYVSGDVQGVFFRHHAQEMARQSNVNGWVRNLRDGRVEAVFEGEREQVEALVEFCRRGPPSARVEGVELRWEEPTGEFSDFKIKWW